MLDDGNITIPDTAEIEAFNEFCVDIGRPDKIREIPDVELYHRAIISIREFQLVKSDAVGYKELGYMLDNGSVNPVKLLEYEVLASELLKRETKR